MGKDTGGNYEETRGLGGCARVHNPNDSQNHASSKTALDPQQGSRWAIRERGNE